MQVERKICFPKGRKLKIMQVSDPQDMHFVRKAMIKMLDKAYDTVKPDLIVFTGDNVHGNHLDENRLGMSTKDVGEIKKNMKKAISYIAEPLEKRQIPFCMIYGNHDDLNPISKQEQADLYKDYKYFFGLNSDEPELDCDTYNVPIYSSDGKKIKFNLWMLDSAGKDDGTGKGYSYVKKEAVEWYKRKSDELTKENNGEKVPSLMFQHIPIPQTTSLFTECEADDKDAVKWRGSDGKPYKLDLTKAKGYAAEYPEVCEADFGQLEAVKEKGDVCALVFGHDHPNSFIGEVEGVKIIQSPGASFRSYGIPRSRGVRVFEIDENDPCSFETYEIGYFDLFGENAKTKIEYFMNADEYDYKRAILLGSLGLAAVVAIVLLIIFL